jgi:glycerol kinase
MRQQYILAIDEGTTSARSVLFDKAGHQVAIAQRALTQLYPQAGWVEHDALEIWAAQLGTMREVMRSAQIDISQVAAIGITNQRETTVVWDKKTGIPVYHAIVWQDKRTLATCAEINKKKDLAKHITEVTGLPVDPYFSATKLKWILDNVKGARKRAEDGELCFGTIDSWLTYQLTSGQLHITDYSNASRTMLYNIKTKKWDDTILTALKIPRIMLPEVMDSSKVYGLTSRNVFDEKQIPIAALIGDQQAALFGQGCHREGMAKNTYGTGCFMLMHTGSKLVRSRQGLLTTIAWGIDGRVEYALEGSVFSGGSVVKWLRDNLQLIQTAAETEKIAIDTGNNGGVYFVPAFNGLGTPYWDATAQAAISGMSMSTHRGHIVRAALEAIAYQSCDVLQLMETESKIKLASLRVDGGASVNNFLMQFQANMLGMVVDRPKVTETTALGAAMLAGLAVGFYKKTDLAKCWQLDQRFKPLLKEPQRRSLYEGWLAAVAKVMAK